VEVGDNEVTVGDVKVQGWTCEDDSGQAAEQERDKESDGEHHRCLERDVALPHRADPVEELDPGRNGDEECHEGEERQQDRAGGVHVVRPDRDGQSGDRQRRVHQPGVAEDGFAAEDGEDLGDDPEKWQRDDVDLGVAEEPEQVLPQDGSAVGGVEDLGAESPVDFQSHQRRGEQREREQDQDAGHERVPGEDGHTKHRHPRCAQAHDGGDDVDCAQNGAQSGNCQSQGPHVGAGAGRVCGVGEGSVGGPSEVGCTLWESESAQCDSRSEDEQPEAQCVEPGEGNIGGTDLQGQDDVREADDHGSGVHQQHDCAVHGEQLVVLLSGQELEPGFGQLCAHQQRHQAADEKEGEACHEVHVPDQLVIGGGQDPVDR
jgi:hypothetical protein